MTESGIQQKKAKYGSVLGTILGVFDNGILYLLIFVLLGGLDMGIPEALREYGRPAMIAIAAGVVLIVARFIVFCLGPVAKVKWASQSLLRKTGIVVSAILGFFFLPFAGMGLVAYQERLLPPTETEIVCPATSPPIADTPPPEATSPPASQTEEGRVEAVLDDFETWGNAGDFYSIYHFLHTLDFRIRNPSLGDFTLGWNYDELIFPDRIARINPKDSASAHLAFTFRGRKTDYDWDERTWAFCIVKISDSWLINEVNINQEDTCWDE